MEGEAVYPHAPPSGRPDSFPGNKVSIFPDAESPVAQLTRLGAVVYKNNDADALKDFLVLAEGPLIKIFWDNCTSFGRILKCDRSRT